MENREFYIDSVIKNEKQKYQEYKNQLLQKLGEYPRGTLVVRESGGRKYCYFRYRDGKRVITKYAGTIKKYDELRARIAERDCVIEEIKRIDAELGRMEKMVSII